MSKSVGVLGAVVVVLVGCARPASADWLLTGYIAPLFNVKTTETTTIALPAERFEDSVGFGVNFASAFASRGNLGFEFDWAWYPKALHTSDVFGTAYASRLMSISTNFFYSPAVPRVRPYFSLGPSFHYRIDDDEAVDEIPSGWAAGVNGGAGVMVFVHHRLGVRIDVRYHRNFGAFYDLRDEVTERNSGWNNLQFIRAFLGATVVL